jgi:hypothetical protein
VQVFDGGKGRLVTSNRHQDTAKLMAKGRRVAQVRGLRTEGGPCPDFRTWDTSTHIPRVFRSPSSIVKPDHAPHGQ